MNLDGPAATRARGGIDLALVLSMLSRSTHHSDEPDAQALTVAELGAMTVAEAADRVVALMDAEAARLAPDPRQLDLFNR